MIRVRLLVGFILVALLPVLGVGVGTYLVSYQNGRQQSIDRLESVAARKELAVQVWTHSLQQELQIASQTDYSPKLVTNALRLSNEGANYTWYYDLVRKRLQFFVNQSSDFDELFLVNLEGHVVVSTNPRREAYDYGEQSFFHEGLINPTTRLPFYTSSSSLDYPAPLEGDLVSAFVVIPLEGDNGQLGILCGRVHVDALYGILDEKTGLGETGEAYLVDQEGTLLVGTHLASDQAESDSEALRLAQSRGIEDAIQYETNFAGIYKNTLGTPVVGIYRWLPELNVVLTVEQDSSEAFQAVSTTTTINLIIALVALALAVSAALFMTRNIADPIVNLASTASQIARGDLDQTANIVREDEVGALANAFNSMTAQLRDLINSLEQRVKERTRDLEKANEALEQRALQMETSAQVGREITSILDIDALLTRVVELIQEAFGYYHVQIYLLDKDGTQLVLGASSGNKSIQHPRIEIGTRSINSQAAQTSQSQLVNDVQISPNYLLDDQLPDTRSELVIPLIVGDRVIGTLDVHNSRVNAFTEEDILVIQSLGDQIAVAIENTHLYDQSKELAVLEERNRLARELHDSVTQSLYSLVLLTEGWRRMINSGGGAQTEEYLTRIGEIAQQALKEMRLLIFELRPPALEQEGLVGAIQKRLDAVEKRVGIESRVVMEDFIEIHPYVEERLFRIAQEALNNSLKHARAARETVRICVEGETIVLEVMDDGVGFDPEAVEHRGGMGLASMRERARQVGGILTIQSILGDGTTVKASVPLPRAG